MAHATTAIRRILIIPEDPKAQTLLLVQVEINCPHCGYVAFEFFGHHLTSIVTALEQIRVANPGLVGEPSVQIGSTEWQGTPPADPSMN